MRTNNIKVCSKTWSFPTSVSFKDQTTKDTTVNGLRAQSDHKSLKTGENPETFSVSVAIGRNKL